ncbi:esterase [Leptospira semungkisensis]|uniref:Esterase n=2 Tax=Leptospira semungkisensis TaxID=2484985 RepID=A0A4R9G636_9LEPT|nr:alpha/beta fold hydrolase [Leptospira semungkisensis]TGK06851.1 esterase [Leptospira semungkisensis]
MRKTYRTLVMQLCMLTMTMGVFLYSCKSESPNNAEAAALLASLDPSLAQAIGNQSGTTGTLRAADTESDIQAAFAQENDGSFTFNNTITVTAFDGVSLEVNLFQPANIPAGSKLPAVVFVNSWALNKYEYIVPAAKLAKKGYIVLCYSTRGFGASGGLIDTAGPKDRADLSTILDWLLANTQTDIANIGISGVSYGAGISLTGVSTEPRIKTAVAMSGWGDLKRSLYGNDTPRLVWGLILVASSYITGKPDPIVAQNFANLIQHINIDFVTSWAADRSPQTYVGQLNASAGKSVMISNNFEDFLFNPNGILDYYTQITVPKKLLMNEGIHASAEAAGLLGISNFVWDNAYDWFDYWLKGVNNGIMAKPQVTFQTRFNGPRVTYPSWPAPTVGNKTYYLKPRGLFTNGEIATSQNTTVTNTTILSGADTVATTGFPLLSDILSAQVGIPTTTNLFFESRVNGIVYQSSSLSSALKIRGKIFWNGRISSTLGKANVNVYFYDVAKSGTATLITHGTYTIFDAAANEARDISIDLNAVAYDVPAGDSIAIAIDTYDVLYSVPTTLVYGLDVKHLKSPQTTLVIQSE